MRLVMMGTGPFAAPTFKALYETPHQVLALVTQPPRETHAHRPPPPSPVRVIAEQHSTPILAPEKPNTPEAHARTPIGPDEGAIELELRLAQLGAPLICRTIDELAAGTLSSLPQDPALATKARRLRKTDGVIDWSRPAQSIKNQIRALEAW